VIADESSNPSFVAADLLSQAEHGVDSQVVLVGVRLTPEHLSAIEDEVDRQAHQLPRVDIVRESIAKSIIVQASSIEEAMKISNDYAPEHLIVNLKETDGILEQVENAGSVFIGQYTPERYVFRLTLFLLANHRGSVLAVAIMRLARTTLCRPMGSHDSTAV
jgi:phosphoribosyl-ATP pyrophosphohydrolase/phosphoribosyl-AMP cyclohydrolase/histidinol dehydrogenase